MYKLTNIDELAKTIDLYKKGKITQHALESELTKTAQELTYPVSSLVKIDTTDKSRTNSTFGIVTVPFIGQYASVTFYLDNNIILNLLSEDEVVKILAAECRNFQSALREYSKFNLTKADSDVDIRDLLLTFVAIYKNSIDSLESRAPDIFVKLRERKCLPSSDSLAEVYEMIASGRGKTEDLIEKLTINYAFPKIFIEKAKEIIEQIKTEYQQNITKYPDPSGETLKLNAFKTQRRALSDGTYSDKKSYQIPHNYKPDTNQ